MNYRLVAVVVTLRVLTISVSAAQPHSVPAPPPLTSPKVNFVDIAERAGLTAKTEDGGDKTKRYIVSFREVGVKVGQVGAIQKQLPCVTQ